VCGALIVERSTQGPGSGKLRIPRIVALKAGIQIEAERRASPSYSTAMAGPHPIATADRAQLGKAGSLTGQPWRAYHRLGTSAFAKTNISIFDMEDL
jgi:hypothetical protein